MGAGAGETPPAGDIRLIQRRREEEDKEEEEEQSRHRPFMDTAAPQDRPIKVETKVRAGEVRGKGGQQ